MSELALNEPLLSRRIRSACSPLEHHLLTVSQHLAERGEYRRAILVHREPGRVIAELEDNVHHFFAAIWHDGKLVTKAEGGGKRIPFSTCGDGAAQMGSLVGFPVTADVREGYRYAGIRGQCTHAFQLALHAVVHATRMERQRLYEVQIVEPSANESIACLAQNGMQVLRWTLETNLITSPGSIAGLATGAAVKWTFENEPESAEAAIILHRACLQAAAQRRVTHLSHKSAADLSTSGVCYTFQPGRAETAIALHSTRNFEREGVWPLRAEAENLRRLNEASGDSP